MGLRHPDVISHDALPFPLPEMYLNSRPTAAPYIGPRREFGRRGRHSDLAMFFSLGTRPECSPSIDIHRSLPLRMHGYSQSPRRQPL